MALLRVIYLGHEAARAENPRTTRRDTRTRSTILPRAHQPPNTLLSTGNTQMPPEGYGSGTRVSSVEVLSLRSGQAVLIWGRCTASRSSAAVAAATR